MRDLVIVGYFELYNKPFNSNKSLEPFIDFLKDHKNKDVLFWNPSEPITIPFDYYDWDELYRFEKFLIDNDLFVYGLYGGDKVFKSVSPPIQNYQVLSWNTFLLHYTKFYLEKSYNKDIRDININPVFNKHFFSLNKHPRSARSFVIDNLYRLGLFDYGLISWNNLSNSWQEPYKFEYWDEKIMRVDIDVPEINKLNIHTSFNTDFLLNSGCVFNFVVETMVDNRNLLITEKTFKNFLIGQPFISIGSVLHNRTLSELGFYLYDEIFDYSFDSEIDDNNRLLKFVNELQKIKDYRPEDLFDKIKTKVLNNKENSIKLCDKDDFIPTKIIEMYHNHADMFNNNPYINKECNIKEIFKNY